MTEGNFVDYVKIYVASGKGGKGSSHLHREKFIEKGQLNLPFWLGLKKMVSWINLWNQRNLFNKWFEIHIL